MLLDPLQLLLGQRAEHTQHGPAADSSGVDAVIEQHQLRGIVRAKQVRELASGSGAA